MGGFNDFMKENEVSLNAKAEAAEADRPGMIGEGIKRGLARGVGRVGDAPTSAYQIVKAALNQPFSFVASKLTGRPESEFLSDPDIGATTMFQDYLTNAWANPEVKPRSGAEKIQLGVGEAVGESMYPSGLMKSAVGSGLKTIAKTAAVDTAKNVGMGGLAGLGASSASVASDGNPVAELLGGIAAPAAWVAISPVLVAKRLLKASMERGRDVASNAADEAPSLVNKFISGKVVDAVAGNPSAPANAQEALRVGEKMGPNWRPSIGEMTDTDALLDMERRFAGSSTTTLNREAARREGNISAVGARYASVRPEIEGQDVSQQINTQLSAQQGNIDRGISAVTLRAPAASQADAGEGILGAAKQMKRETQANVITPAYERAFTASGNAKMSLDNVIAEAENVLGESIAKIKPDVAPNTIAAIRAMKPKQDAPLQILGSDGAPISEVLNKTSAEATLREIDGLHRAINMDVRTALASGDQAAAMKARNLMRLHDEIDDAVKNGNLPQAAKDAYSYAVQTWKTEFKPRFKEGVNADLLRGSRRNEPSSIRLDEVTGKYFRPGGEVEAKQFITMARGNPAAVSGIKSGIMDIYRAEVINPQTGKLDAVKHNSFMHKYEKPLSVFNQYGLKKELQDIGKELTVFQDQQKLLGTISKRIGYESTDQLVSSIIANDKNAFLAAGVLTPGSRKMLSRAVMDRVWDSGQTNAGLNADAMTKFMSDNRQGIMKALTAAEGTAGAATHMANMDDIVKAAQIATRNKGVAGVAGVSDDPLRAATGVSLSTVMSQARGIQMGRTSLPVAASMMAGPILKKIGLEKFDELMYGALHNKAIAADLSELLRAKTAKDAEGFGKRLLSHWNENKAAYKAAAGVLPRIATDAMEVPNNIKRMVAPTLGQISTEQP